MSSNVKSGIKSRHPIIDLATNQAVGSQEWFTRHVLPLSLEQLRWRPAPGAWSIVECLEHLNLTLEALLPRIEEAMRSGNRNVVDLAREAEVVQQVEPPVTVSRQAPALLVPPASVDPEWLVERFRRTREGYADAVRRALELDYESVVLAAPVASSGIRSLGGALAFLAAHERRHLWQAEQVKSAPGFPHGV